MTVDEFKNVKLGQGFNSERLICDLFAKTPEYLKIVYETYTIPDEVREAIEYYLKIEKGEQKMAKAKDTLAETTASPVETLGLLNKINLIRKAWSTTEIEKGGKGKAGGGAKYDYYKPQQIIDFCLAQELEHDIFSEFKIREDGFCTYNLVDIPTGEMRNTECPFDIPRKMAASEAQQVGAAMTYHNRRLAMMMYKIEDNSKESVDILGDADFSAQNIPAPIIPAPPIIAPPPVVQAMEVVERPEPIEITPPITDQVIPPQPPVAPISEPIAVEPANTPIVSAPATDEPANKPERPTPITPYMSPSDVMNGTTKKTEVYIPPMPAGQPLNAMTPPVEPVAVAAPAKKSIEALYD